jgi:carbon-monoxide dehydrogenase iron sulfur subunit
MSKTKRRIIYNPEVCMACKLCEVYCLTAHSKTKNVMLAYKKEFPRAMSRTIVEERGIETLSVQCRHCEEPVCIEACMTGAMYKSPDGQVLCDSEKCVGCWMCIMVCPFGAIERNITQKHISSKCDLCPERTIPACVENCPNRALTFEET